MPAKHGWSGERKSDRLLADCCAERLKKQDLSVMIVAWKMVENYSEAEYETPSE